jgi:hypothetical protein
LVERVVNGDTDATLVPHFQLEFNVEQRLKKVATGSGKKDWTIVRPVPFMENLSSDFLGKAFTTIWKLNGMPNGSQAAVCPYH